MLVFGPYQACVGAINQSNRTILLNFSSLTQYVPRLDQLMPSFDGNLYDEDMEIKYSNYIILNDMAFCQLMEIMYPVYEGVDVFVCTSGETMNQYINTMNELLQNFIKNRYGYSVAIINEPEDLKSYSEFGFSVQGILNLDQDKERWILMVEEARLRAGGEPYK